MAQGDLWQMGVGLYVANPSFRFPCRVETTVGTAFTGDILHCEPVGLNGWQGTKNELQHYVRPNDMIVLGPSSWAGDEGKVLRMSVDGAGDLATYESRVIGNEIDMHKSTGLIDATSLNAGDPVAFIGRATAAGWHVWCVNVADFDKVKMWPIDGEMWNYADIKAGYDDRWHLRPELLDARAGEVQIRAAKDSNLTEYLRTLEVSATYKVLCYYKYLGAGLVGVPYLQLKYAGAVVAQAALGSSATWTEISGIGTTSAAEDEATNLYFTFPAAVTGAHYLLDCIAVCHASGTDDAASGIWTFDEYAEGESIHYHQRNVSQAVRLPNQSMATDWPGRDNEKWVVRASFRNVGQSMYDNLLKLKEWQMRGNGLLLAPKINDLPPFIYGTMTMTDDKSSWDLTKRDIDLEFTEL